MSVFRVSQHIGDVDRATLHCDPSDQSAAVGSQGIRAYERLRFVRKAARRDQVIVVVAPAVHSRIVGTTEPDDRFYQRIKHRLEVDSGAADNLEYVCSRGLLLKGFPQFREQPCILDSDHRLLREVAEQFDLLIVEQPDLLPIDGDDTDHLVISQHRHDSSRPSTAKLDQLNGGLSMFEISGSGSQVSNVNHLLAADCDRQCALRMRARDLIGSCCSKHGRGIVERSLAHEPLLD
jgi:hypothetical protein